MKINSTFLFLIFLLCSHFAIAQLTIQVNAIPENTPSNASIYVAGNFNNWNAGEDIYQLSQNGNGTFFITFSPNAGQVEFKFTRGDWGSVEGNENGNFIPNRIINYSGGQQTEYVTIAGWEDGGGGNGTLAENAYILSADFEMPQLNRTRRIWIYLPPDYENTDLSYPVMYMQDGQNLFDVNTSFSGEWEVDEALNTLFDNGDEGIIIVGIDNGGEHRIDEYSPWVNPQYGGGEGAAYVNFIIENLKPTIDNNFRTKPDRLNTGIMGSSLGALVSFYAAIEHQDVFGKAGVFSPSFWFSNEVFSHVENTGKLHDMKIYLLGGEQESETLIDELNTMKSTLLAAGFEDSEIKLLTHPDGQHSEWYWRREFSDAYLWLFADLVDKTETLSFINDVKIHPNPVYDTLYIQAEMNLAQSRADIYNSNGTLVLSQGLNSEAKLIVEHLPKGIYLLSVWKGKQQVLVTKFAKE